MNDGTHRQTWWRKRNRLDRSVYRGPGMFSITATTWRRRRVFVDGAEVRRYQVELGECARTNGFVLLAYCFMPDHLHVLVEGSEGSDLARFVKAFKQASSFDYRRRIGRPLWQRSYYDHALRGEGELGAAVEYILGNPVRAGLVEDAAAYPFLGGQLLEEMLVAT